MAETKRPKSPPIAFMPTPNDILLPPSRESQRTSSLTSPLSGPMQLPERAFPRSASRIPSVVSPERLPSPSRAMTPSAVPPNHESWYTLCQKQQDLFREKEKMNDLERRLLLDRIASLESDLMIERTKYRQLQLACESGNGGSVAVVSPPSTRNSSVSTEPLHERRRSSGHSESNGSVSAEPTSSSAAGRRSTSATRMPLPPVTEEEEKSPARNGNSIVGFVPVNGSSMPQTNGVKSKPKPPPLRFNDDVSPMNNHTPRPTDANSDSILSPPPPEYVAHAGHTPIKPTALSIASTPSNGADTPTQENTQQNSERPLTAILDPDPPLRGPLSLPTKPESADDRFLSALNGRLNHMTEHPEVATPTVLRGQSLDDDESVVSGDGAVRAPEHAEQSTSTADIAPAREGTSTDLKSPNGAIEPAPTAMPPGEEDENGVKPLPDGLPKLKAQRSMNFGAPLGSLRKAVGEL